MALVAPEERGRTRVRARERPYRLEGPISIEGGQIGTSAEEKGRGRGSSLHMTARFPPP